MVKAFVLFGTQAPIGEICDRRWSDPPVADRCGLRRYARDRILPQEFPGLPGELPYGAVAELWFADLEAAVAELAGDASPLRAGDLAEAERPAFVLTRENVVIPGPPGDGGWRGLKALFFIRHKDGKDRRHFQEYWRNRHAPLVIGTPGLERYVQCHVATEGDAVGQSSFDGVGELCFSDWAGFERCWGSPEIREVQLPDTGNFVRRDSIGFFVEETRVV